MKKYSLIIILSLSSLGAFAQHYQLIEAFQLSASEGGYGIYADIDPTGAKDMLFDMDAPNYSQNVRMRLPSNSVKAFLSSMKDAKDVYVKWKSLANSNSVTQFSKNMNVSFADKGVYFTSEGHWYYENGVDLSVRFYVDEDGVCYLVLETDYMTSEQIVQHGVSFSSAYNSSVGRWALGWSDSKTTVTHYCAGASLFFSSEKEIDIFMEKLNLVKEWKENNVTLGKIFK